MTNENEQMALLLGWEQVDRGLRTAPEYEVLDEAPDFTQWDRFPEMQEYVRGLDANTQAGIEFEMMAFLPWYETNAIVPVANVTPTILRDAILEVCA